jgi:hypothetical protein
MAEYNWTEIEGKNKKNNKNDADVRTWRGEAEGESIFGKVEEFKEVTRKDGTPAHVLNLFNDAFNEYYTVWPKGQLLRKLEAANVAPGSIVKIEFEGFKPLISNPDRSYRAYKVFVAEE